MFISPHLHPFLSSLLTYPFQSFLTQLVCNLLDEGNCCFRDGDWRQATQQYGEGISVSRYAQTEALIIPHELLESLYVNRAAAFYQMVRITTALMFVGNNLVFLTGFKLLKHSRCVLLYCTYTVLVFCLSWTGKISRRICRAGVWVWDHVRFDPTLFRFFPLTGFIL